ncbi:hypothetical protein Syun_028332 [Stephania yunnanensis]|uniref:Delta(3)-Delta(2)-enoyl-CoA isomerase n=1 Tax=Stephania yunnanensis TaxID=152371 RepID=A0AAP0HR10_9MAGN
MSNADPSTSKGKGILVLAVDSLGLAQPSKPAAHPSWFGLAMCTLENRGDLFLLTLTGDNEHRINPSMIDKIRTALHQVRTEAKAGSVLITTAEGKFFSNGFDLAWAQAAGSGFRDRLHHMVESFRPVVADLISLPLPTIAAVTGHAAAAGLMLAISHDYVLMRKDRGVLYMSELDIGMTFPDYFMVVMRSKFASPIALRNVVLQAAKLKPMEALKMGIIDSVHESPKRHWRLLCASRRSWVLGSGMGTCIQRYVKLPSLRFAICLGWHTRKC